MIQEIDAVERHLREQAASKAVKDADTYGWAEVRQGVFLDTADRLKSAGQSAEGAPYFLSTNDGEHPKPSVAPVMRSCARWWTWSGT